MSQLTITLQERDPPLGVAALHGEHDAYSSTRLEHELALLLDDRHGVVSTSATRASSTPRH